IVAGSTSARSGEVRVFDVIGRFVRLAEVEDCDERSCRFRVDGFGLPPGVYFARLQSGSTVRTVPVIRH
ncbi:MAG: T9SS type A sorting domain-containing protein, partial [Bacteroidetes bacterium]|nr:T9SS type A sorting domain-containing protein [Bacteroidota bacterium]